MTKAKLEVQYVPIEKLKASKYNPRKWSKTALKQLKESIKSFDCIDPLIVNGSPKRKNILIGGHMRLTALKELGYAEVPIVYINIGNETKEKELNLRLNKNTGEFDIDLLASFNESLLNDVGFDSIELDEIFEIDDLEKKFDLQKELAKLDIQKIKVKKGQVYKLGRHRVMCGSSTIEIDMLKLMNGQKADMCFTDQPYLLSYLKDNKKRSKGFGAKQDRRYIETDSLPDNFVELWMNNVAKIQKPNFSIIAFEHPKNLRVLWDELEKHWRYRNTIIWHLPNRMQGHGGKYRLFNKFDIAVLGTSGQIKLNDNPESDSLLQEEYEAAIFATSGQPHWEKYGKGKRYCPTDFIEHRAVTAKDSGQSVIFGCKPIEILIPYIKILTQRNDLIVEPFGGSGSTLMAAEKLKRRCYLMEKVPAYIEVIIKRFEFLTGTKAKLIAKA